MADSGNSIEKRRSNLNRAHTFFDDVMNAGLESTANLFKTLNESVKQRNIILQDIANVSLAILGGMITLTIFAKTRIKTDLIFYLAGAGFVLCIMAAFAIRMILLKVWDALLEALRERDSEIRNAGGHAKYHSTEGHEDAIHDFQEVMSYDLTPSLPWQLNVTTVTALASIFIASLVLLGLSLLFDITTK